MRTNWEHLRCVKNVTAAMIYNKIKNALKKGVFAYITTKNYRLIAVALVEVNKRSAHPKQSFFQPVKPM